MATVVRGRRDKYVERIKDALDEYERKNPGAGAELYREGPALIWIRIIDKRYAKLSKSARHDRVWNFLASRLDEDTMQEIAVLLPLAPAEQRSSIMSAEFDHPIKSAI